MNCALCMHSIDFMLEDTCLVWSPCLGPDFHKFFIVPGQREHVFGWLVVLRIYVASAVFHLYRDLEAGDNQSLKFKWRGGESNPGLLASQAKSLTTRPPPLPKGTCKHTKYVWQLQSHLIHSSLYLARGKLPSSASTNIQLGWTNRDQVSFLMFLRTHAKTRDRTHDPSFARWVL